VEKKFEFLGAELILFMILERAVTVRRIHFVEVATKISALSIMTISMNKFLLNV
jgi:hypothetical protein